MNNSRCLEPIFTFNSSIDSRIEVATPVIDVCMTFLPSFSSMHESNAKSKQVMTVQDSQGCECSSK
jgi:hypothetical protein